MSTDLNLEGLRWQTNENTRDIERLKESARELPVTKRDLEHLTRRVDALYKLGWSILGGLVLLIVSVLIAAAQLGGV